MLIRVVGLVVLVILSTIAGLIAFGTAKAPTSSGLVAAFKGADYASLPAVEHYAAHDGASLGYRRYSAASPVSHVAVLIHGASDSGFALDRLAQSLQSANVTTYVPEERGHGSSLPHGDIAYVGQLDDDLAEFVADIQTREPGATLRLAGFSSGGGFVLKFAGGPRAGLFDRYLLLSPALTYRGPIVRPKPKEPTAASSFSVPYVPRLIGLGLANAVGVHAFDSLPVLAFAVPEDSRVLTRTYSLRLLNNLIPADYIRAIAALAHPTSVIIGDADEFSIASEVARAFAAARPAVAVHILPSVGHMGLVKDPAALAAIGAWATAE